MLFHFPNEFKYEPLEIYPYDFIDLFNAIKIIHPDYLLTVFGYLEKGYDFNLIDIDKDLQITPEKIQTGYLGDINNLQLEMYLVGSGSGLGRIGLGVGLLALGLTGVGFLGISATTLTLTGASLLFSSIFKHPKQNNKNNVKAEKRSVNFSGVINTTGGGQVTPLLFGEVSTGSIVASAQIVPYDA